MPKLKKLLTASLVLIFFLNLIFPISTQADIVDCDVQVTPNQVDSGSTNDFSAVITNGSISSIHWVKFTRPSANFTLSSVTVPSGWSVDSTSADVITVSGGSINFGASRTFTLTGVVAANVNAPSANWTIETSDDVSGINPYSCTGTLGTQIGTVDTTDPAISNVQVASLTHNSATVTWTTDELADSRVDYGLTAGYGANSSDSNLTTSHSINLTGLTASTGYHYKVTSADASTNSSESSDNTFQTSSTPAQPNTVTITPTTTTNNSSDTTKPVVTVDTDLSKFYKETPEISGTATDNVAVTTIEFSTDNGLNWLPVTTTTGLVSKQATFKFKPTNLPDGNFQIVVRATDSSGNIGVSETKVLVIDRILPVIGPTIISVGPQIVRAEVKTTIAVKDVDQKVTLSAIGGPTNIDIIANKIGSKTEKNFTLAKSTSSELWSGIFAFDEAGSYTLWARGVDGAGNKTSRELGQALVYPTSKVVSKTTGSPIEGAKVTLNYFDSETSTWVVWDGASFGEKNPQTTNGRGEFNFYIPEGKYYLKTEAANFNTSTSEIFVLDKSLNLSATVELKPAIQLKLGNFVLTLPTFSFTSDKLSFSNREEQLKEVNDLENKDLPDFSLMSTSGKTIVAAELLGKNTLVSLLTTWDPSTSEQIAQLESLNNNTDFNLVKINLLESKEKIKSYKKIAGYKGDFLADETGNFLSKINPNGLPYNIFVSRSGKIKHVLNGVLTTEQLRYNLEN